MTETAILQTLLEAARLKLSETGPAPQGREYVEAVMDLHGRFRAHFEVLLAPDGGEARAST